ncbi:hypothetical protein [Neobacillus sp. 19]|uniref:hypothetical protein n=1 Tax=Neobacillus sp. 19 TaxID=3394458 RepID=UPI003BF69034
MGVADSGQAWQNTVGGFGIQNNEAYRVSGSNTVASIDAGRSDNIAISAKMAANSSGQRIIFRIADSSNYLFAQQQGTTLRIYKNVSAASTQLASITVDTLQIGDLLKVVLSGSQIDVYRNGVKSLSTNDNFNQSFTKHGFGGSADVRFDDFRVEEI